MSGCDGLVSIKGRGGGAQGLSTRGGYRRWATNQIPKSGVWYLGVVSYLGGGASTKALGMLSPATLSLSLVPLQGFLVIIGLDNIDEVKED